MKNQRLILLSSILLFASCNDKDAGYYKNRYETHKGDYVDVKTRLDRLLDKNDSLFKFMVEYTGRRIVQYQYENDSIKRDFENIELSSEDESVFGRVMYNQDLKYVIVYRDSAKYVFSGRHQDIIVKYKANYKPHGGILIDANTYLFFEGTSGY